MSPPDTPYRLSVAAAKADTKPAGSHLHRPGEGSCGREILAERAGLGDRPLMGKLWLMAASVEMKSGLTRSECFLPFPGMSQARSCHCGHSTSGRFSVHFHWLVIPSISDVDGR